MTKLEVQIIFEALALLRRAKSSSGTLQCKIEIQNAIDKLNGLFDDENPPVDD